MRLLCLSVAICLTSCVAYAQQSYVRLLGSLNFAASGSYYAYGAPLRTSSPATQVYRVSLGEGFSGDLAFGRMINDNLGVEAGFSLFSGFSHSSSVKLENAGGDMEIIDNTRSGSMLRFTPSALFIIPLEEVEFLDDFSVFARIGIAIGLVPGIQWRSKFTDELSGSYEEFTFEMYGGVPLGFASAAGIDFSLNERMRLFGELNYLGMSYAPQVMLLSRYVVDGESVLSQVPAEQRNISLVEDYHGAPSTYPRESYPFSSFGFGIGLRLVFGEIVF